MIYIPSIVLAELYFLNEKLGRSMDFAKEYQRLESSKQFEFVPFYPQDILDFDQDVFISEMHDRMVVGVARRLKAACITLDKTITNSNLVTTIW